MIDSPIPLKSLPGSLQRLARSRSSSRDPPLGANVQELPQIDKGKKAWAFCFCSFILETMIFGFVLSYGIFQEYYMANPPFNTSSTVTLSAIGTTALALQYGGCLLVMLFYRRYPDLIRRSMWFGLALCSSSLCLSSFATKVWQLIVLQGVMFGIGGGLLYVPVIIWLPEWFVERRGLASGLIFGGSGIGG
ncbi:hypothetical protein JAAARDRAFT_54850 [Jaapia argillacea MUCL 33604]|uniref:Major facilitator superfamily (MFS) profile domain-containing protein n=1 Tax=Jaapia argillacea MUCL 33604 TaxID=933084 RepID=A0A067Q359_9AGAM|nr:hypothetical protein JAAARDRAFT_54850 [Jaapia argillacea MUCL 33604]